MKLKFQRTTTAKEPSRKRKYPVEINAQSPGDPPDPPDPHPPAMAPHAGEDCKLFVYGVHDAFVTFDNKDEG